MTFYVQKYLDSLPTDTTCIYLQNKKLTHLPELSRFSCLKVLDCSENKLRYLPALPRSLETLICSYNQLINLPELPESLLYLSCSYNPLTFLPVLPQNLKSLLCNNNKLVHLPKLPSSLVQLSCYEYLIRPDSLPQELKCVFQYDNQPYVGPIDQLQKLMVFPEMCSQIYESRKTMELDDNTCLTNQCISNNNFIGWLFYNTGNLISSKFNHFISSYALE